MLYVSLGANFEKHYATSGLAAIVLLAVWLFLANVVVLAAYRWLSRPELPPGERRAVGYTLWGI